MCSSSPTKNWNLLIEGERQGLYECFNLFYDDLFRFGLSMYKDPELIKESIQNLFIELWEMRDKLRDVRNVKQYIFTIFKRIIYKTNKKLDQNTLDLSSILEEINNELVIQNSYESILILNQQDQQKKEQLKIALNNLSPRQKQIIELRFFQGKSYLEIIRMTNLTERTVYNTLHNAIKVLRESPYFCLK